jgi:superoxide reductase
MIHVTVGKEIPHPNTTEHHIRWIRLYFKPEGGKFAYDLGTFEFNAHGESVDGPNKGPAYTEFEAQGFYKIETSGTLLAMSYCNIHGLWESSRAIKVK